VLVFILKTKMTAIAMNVLLHQLQEIVPAFNVASVPKDATGAYASPVHIIAGLIDKTPTYIQKIINDICSNVNANCTKLKVIVYGTEQRNRIMVGNAESILRILGSCNRQDMAAIVAKLHVVVPVSQAPSVAPASQAPFVAEAPQVPVTPTPKAPFVAQAPQAPDDAMDVDGVSTNDLQNDDDMTIQDHFDFVPAQMVEFVLELNGSRFNIPVRRDGYVNVTKICQAAKKRLQHYKESPAGNEYMEFLKNRNLAKSDSRIPAIALLTSIKGGNINTVMQGTFAHPDLAMAIAMWAHPPFLAEVTSWIQELLITGRVELGKEKTPEELDAIWKSRIAEEQAKIQADYLREKLSKELLAIDEDIAAKRARRQRDDAAADEERAAKRQREDVAAAVAVEEEKKDRAAKRQRDDTAVDDKTKEEIRMQLVRFNAETAAKAIAAEEEKEAKRQRDDAAFEKEMQEKDAKLALVKEEHDNRLALVKRNENLALVQNSPDFGNNAHLIALWNDIKMDVLNQIKKQVTGECSLPQETKFCDDITTIGKKMGFAESIVETHRSALGRVIAQEYFKRFNENPPKGPKYVNGGNRSVNTYGAEHHEWIGEIVRNFLADKATPPISTQASQASRRGINKYFPTM
jgi:hypothetical protein